MKNADIGRRMVGNEGNSFIHFGCEPQQHRTITHQADDSLILGIPDTDDCHRIYQTHTDGEHRVHMEAIPCPDGIQALPDPHDCRGPKP